MSQEIRNIPVILLTNLDNDPIVKEALNQGVTDCLVKADITPDQLLVCAKKYIIS